NNCIQVEDISSIYETEPVGYVDQANFLNIVIKISTLYTPYKLLGIAQEIELKLGRTRDIRWGPRTIDIDILLYNNDRIDTETLTIPHQRMYERAFVLIPLQELGVDVPSEMAQGGVVQWKKKDTEDVFGLF